MPRIEPPWRVLREGKTGVKFSPARPSMFCKRAALPIRETLPCSASFHLHIRQSRSDLRIPMRTQRFPPNLIKSSKSQREHAEKHAGYLKTLSLALEDFLEETAGNKFTNEGWAGTLRPLLSSVQLMDSLIRVALHASEGKNMQSSHGLILSQLHVEMPWFQLNVSLQT